MVDGIYTLWNNTPPGNNNSNKLVGGIIIVCTIRVYVVHTHTHMMSYHTFARVCIPAHQYSSSISVNQSIWNNKNWCCVRMCCCVLLVKICMQQRLYREVGNKYLTGFKLMPQQYWGMLLVWHGISTPSYCMKQQQDHGCNWKTFVLLLWDLVAHFL